MSSLLGRRRGRVMASFVVLGVLGGATAARVAAGGVPSSQSSTPAGRAARVAAGPDVLRPAAGGTADAAERVASAGPTILPSEAALSSSPLHRGITATTFWVGEAADGDNGHIANSASTWDDHWLGHYGGVDGPDHRIGWRPAAFVPRENPFYVALPYNDLDDDGQVKASASAIPWSTGRTSAQESVLKNTWVRIRYGATTVYAQWEDAGPFGEDDFASVFGHAPPRNTRNNSAGIDVSPAVQDYLGLDGLTAVDWQFVARDDIPPGPWLQTVTTSRVTH